jgi:hypothetical protein
MEGSLRLSATGEWWHEGTPFSHPELMKLFHRSIVWDETAQRYMVKIGVGVAHFTLDDTAYFVAEILEAPDRWQVTLFDGTTELLEPETLSVGAAHQIYCRVKGGHRARFSRAAHQHLMRHALSDTEIEIAGEKIKLQREV